MNYGKHKFDLNQKLYSIYNLVKATWRDDYYYFDCGMKLKAPIELTITGCKLEEDGTPIYYVNNTAFSTPASLHRDLILYPNTINQSIFYTKEKAQKAIDRMETVYQERLKSYSKKKERYARMWGDKIEKQKEWINQHSSEFVNKDIIIQGVDHTPVWTTITGLSVGSKGRIEIHISYTTNVYILTRLNWHFPSPEERQAKQKEQEAIEAKKKEAEDKIKVEKEKEFKIKIQEQNQSRISFLETKLKSNNTVIRDYKEFIKKYTNENISMQEELDKLKAVKL